MSNVFLLRKLREHVASLIAGHDAAALNRIPEGLNNNLIWNAGHLLATTDLLIYGLGGQRTQSDREFIDRYRKGTRPEGEVSAAEIADISERLLTSVDRLEADLDSLDWSNFREYTNSLGITLRSVDDALAFNLVHEGMHYGTMLAMRKLV